MFAMVAIIVASDAMLVPSVATSLIDMRRLSLRTGTTISHPGSIFFAFFKRLTEPSRYTTNALLFFALGL